MVLPANFGGVVPPICTPFNDRGEIDIPSFERLLRFQIEGGVTGIFALGTTSETGALTDTQRKLVIEVAVATVAGQVPVIVGALASATNATIEYAQQAEMLGADAVVALGPYYHKFNDVEIAHHFRSVAAAIDVPLIAYNIPQMTQTDLSSNVVITLAREGVIAGLKDSSGNEASFRNTIINTRGIEGFSVFTGGEVQVDYAMYAGAAGIVPGLGNVDPAGYRRLFDAATAQDWDTARAEQERLQKLFSILSQATPGRVGITSGVIGGYKTALREMGVIESNAMAVPFQPLNDEEAARIRTILVEVGLV